MHFILFKQRWLRCFWLVILNTILFRHCLYYTNFLYLLLCCKDRVLADFIISVFSALFVLDQRKISSKVRKQPRHTSSSSRQQLLTQGDWTSDVGCLFIRLLEWYSLAYSSWNPSLSKINQTSTQKPATFKFSGILD